MSTVRETVKELYAKLAGHHATQAQDDRENSADCAALSECAKAAGDKDAAKAHSAMAKRFSASADRHHDAADEFAGMTKALAAADLAKANQIVPDGVTRVHPAYPNVRAVPRAGQPDPGAANAVPIQFEKLVALDED